MSIISMLSLPKDWQVEPFGRIAPRVQVTGRSDLQSLSVFLDEGVVPRSSRDDNFNRLGEDLDRYLLVEPGDIVFNKLRTWQGGLGVSQFQGIVSPAYFVCRPVSGVEPRYLHYTLRSVPYLQELTRISKWMPPSQFDISWKQLRLLPVPVPDLSLQQAIADYLDAETARIDALVHRKRKMIDLLEERLEAVISTALWDDRSGYEPVRLKHVTALPTSGNRDHSFFTYSDTGVPCIRGVDLSTGRIDENDIARIPLEEHKRHANTILHQDDLVFVRSGATAGLSALVPPNLDGSNCVDLVIVRSSRKLVPEYLSFVLRSREAQDQIRLTMSGALQPHFNAVDAAELVLPMRSVTEQECLVRSLSRTQSITDLLGAGLRKQIELLTEHRGCLISALVTGQLSLQAVAA